MPKLASLNRFHKYCSKRLVITLNCIMCVCNNIICTRTLSSMSSLHLYLQISQDFLLFTLQASRPTNDNGPVIGTPFWRFTCRRQFHEHGQRAVQFNNETRRYDRQNQVFPILTTLQLVNGVPDEATWATSVPLSPSAIWTRRSPGKWSAVLDFTPNADCHSHVLHYFQG